LTHKNNFYLSLPPQQDDPFINLLLLLFTAIGKLKKKILKIAVIEIVQTYYNNGEGLEKKKRVSTVIRERK